MKTFQIKWEDIVVESISDEDPEKAKVAACNMAQLFSILYPGATMRVVGVEENE